jgi:hypothetical protein
MSKKKKSKIGYVEFNMHDFARELVMGKCNLSPSSEEIKKEIEKRNNNE